MKAKILIPSGYFAYLYGIVTSESNVIRSGDFSIKNLVIWGFPWLPLLMLAAFVTVGRGRVTLEILTVILTLLAFCMSIPVLYSEVTDGYLLGLLLAYAGLLFVAYATATRQRLAQLALRLLLIGCGLLLALPIAEVGIRIQSANMPYRIGQPNLDIYYHPHQDALPGISGVSHFTTDQYGIRGDPYTDDNRYHILAIGGSTTEVTYLDNTEAWPYLVQETVNENLTDRVWVGNIGRSGHGLVENIHALRYFVPQFRIDAVILMIGINDLQPFLRNPAVFDLQGENPENFSKFLNASFQVRPLFDPNIDQPFPQNLGIYQTSIISRILDSYLRPADPIIVQDEAGNHLTFRREALQSAPELIDELPDISDLLGVYERNLMTAITAASEQDVRLILVTQPAIYSDELSDETQRLLWLGFRGNRAAPDGRYDPAVLAGGLDMFNQTLLNVCSAQKIDCIDLASSMNGDERYFYDDVHFNEAGSRHVAEQISAYLLGNVFE